MLGGNGQGEVGRTLFVFTSYPMGHFPQLTLFPSCLLRATVSAQPGILAGDSALFMLEFIKAERMMDAPERKDKYEDKFRCV